MREVGILLRYWLSFQQKINKRDTDIYQQSERANL